MPTGLDAIQRGATRDAAVAAPVADNLTELQRKQAEIERLDELLKGLRQDREERKKYASYVFWLTSGWIAAVVAILLLKGFADTWHFTLSDDVIRGILWLTTAEILGMLTLVYRYLFSERRIGGND